MTSWISVLDIATEWGFKTIRELAIQSLAPIISPVDQVAFGEKYAVEAWLLPGFRALCSREESLTLEEGRRLGLENVIAIDCARQEIRDQMAARSTAALTTTHCLACKSSDIYTPPSPKLHPSLAQDPPSLVSFWTTGTSSMPSLTALPTPNNQKSSSACRVCGVQQGKLSLAEISRQVERSIPQLAIALEPKIRVVKAKANSKVRMKKAVAKAKAEAEAKADAQAIAKIWQEWKLKQDREKEMSKEKGKGKETELSKEKGKVKGKESEVKVEVQGVKSTQPNVISKKVS